MFKIGQRVKVKDSGKNALNLDGHLGTVIGNDDCLVTVKLDKITEPMLDFEDTKTGVVDFEPDELVLVDGLTKEEKVNIKIDELIEALNALKFKKE